MHVLTAGSPRCGSCRALTCGKYTNKKRTHEHAFVREADGTITKFDPKHSAETQTRVINARGAITGWFQTSDGVTHGFLGKPGGKIVTFDDPDAKSATMPEGMNRNGIIAGVFSDAADR